MAELVEATIPIYPYQFVSVSFSRPKLVSFSLNGRLMVNIFLNVVQSQYWCTCWSWQHYFLWLSSVSKCEIKEMFLFVIHNKIIKWKFSFAKNDKLIWWEYLINWWFIPHMKPQTSAHIFWWLTFIFEIFGKICCKLCN